MRVAIVGVGEVGRCFAESLHQGGADVLLCDACPSAPTIDLAARLGLPLATEMGGWLTSTEWVLSCVPGSEALAVAEKALSVMNANTGFADLTTASPEVKRRAAALASRRTCRYVDVAIMGAIALNGVGTPLLASGNGALELEALLRLAGAKLQFIEGGRPGDAISLKLLRSVFTKGMEALAVELLSSAEKQGIREELYEQLGDIDRTPLRSFLEMLVRTHVVHAKRRAHEVHDARSELGSQGLPSLVLPGVEQRFLATARELERHAVGSTNPSVEQALQWLLAMPEPA